MRSPQRCQHCKVVTSQVIINSRSVLKDGTKSIQWMCNPCNRARAKKYYQANSQRVRAGIYKSIDKHSAKQAARKKLQYALNSGSLTRPTNCEDCGKKCKPHGHHEDYTKPLDVNWLCTTCHSERHQEHRAFVNTAVMQYN